MTLGMRLGVIGTLLGNLLVGYFLLQFSRWAMPFVPDTLPGSQQTVYEDGASSKNAEGGIVELLSQSSGCQLSDRFPASIYQWCDLITQYANKHDLSPDLVAALIMQESGGNSEAYSHSGAVGLMQVMPNDGLAASFMCVNGPCFEDRPSTLELKDPEFNIAYGTRMLAGLVKRNQSLREGLRAYGPMDVGYYYADKVLGLYERYGK